MKNISRQFLLLIFIIFVFIFYLLIHGRSTNNLPSSTKDNKIKVTTSFYPLYFFTGQIGGNRANVINLTRPGMEPHDYEPSTQDVVNMEKSAIIVLNGGGLELWGNKMKKNLQNKNIEMIFTSDGLITKEVEEDGEKIKDPHVWLDPLLAKQQAQKIVAAFSKVDPANKNYYEKNGKTLGDKLDQLDTSFRNELAACHSKNLVTSHAAFGYLAARYGLKQVPISGLSPEEEPSPKKLAEIAQFAKKNNVKYIFFETLVSPRLSETLAGEVGAKTISFNPLEGLTTEEESAGEDYFSIQRKNLKNLKIALECQ